MIGTFFSILLAAFIVFNPFVGEANLNATVLSIAMLATGILFLLMLPASIAFSWLPLQKAEQNATPRILEMYRKDAHLRLTSAWLAIFPLASFVLGLDVLYTHIFEVKIIFAIWIILLGITIDASQYLFKRILGYLNPFAVVEMFTKEANQAIRNEREEDLCQWIDALSEISIKAMQRHSSSLSNASINEQQQIARLFLKSSKSISHHSQDKQTIELGISDKISYVMFFLYQRLELEFDKAIKNNIEPTCSQIIVSLGKIAIDAANYDISIASPPLRFLGKFALLAQEKEMHETSIKASCTLLGVAHTILNEIEIAYQEIKDPFFSIVNAMEELAKGEFRKNKSMNISLLTQPFVELKAMFATGAAKDHVDTPAIIQNIDRVLGEFEALQMVMNTLPTIPEIREETIPPPPNLTPTP
ncbi:MAG: hypothetical protein H0X29_02675 [Parachlamydiaceae bacterium]|nr:hypothetical protein [Parachlamydiaceae bacterium]